MGTSPAPLVPGPAAAPNFAPDIPPDWVESPVTLPNGTPLVSSGAEAGEAAEAATAATETAEAGAAAETAAGVGVGVGAAATAVGLLVLLWPTTTAPAWMDEINPVTGAPYRDQEEYDQVKSLSPDEIARQRVQNASDQLFAAKTDADTIEDAPASSARQSCQAEPQVSPSVQPVVTPQTQRKYADQTCEDERREELQAQKNAACNVPRSCNDQSLDCDDILQRIKQNEACLAARKQMRDECFGGVGDAVHDKQIEEVQNVLDKCNQRAQKDNCL